MKIIITEQQVNELLTSMLEEMFDGYEIKYEGDLRNIYVNGDIRPVTIKLTLHRRIGVLVSGGLIVHYCII